jgi:hypothetical protein
VKVVVEVVAAVVGVEVLVAVVDAMAVLVVVEVIVVSYTNLRHKSEASEMVFSILQL